MKLLLFSGGVESTCLALMTRPDIALTIDYGQVCARGEIRAASHISKVLELRHEVVTAPLSHLGAGDMAGAAPPEDQDDNNPTEYWPLRNQLLITLAAMRYAQDDLREIIIGTVLSDRIHNDGAPAFVSAMSETLRSQYPNMSLYAPALDMTTPELVAQSGASRDLLGWTFSCHRASFACGLCRGCNKTRELFANMDERPDERIATA